MRPGEFVLLPARSGGPHDWMGCRGADVARVDDLKAIVEHCPGRWVIVTLTIDRTNWLSPEHCYQRVCDRVRKVAEKLAPSGVRFVSLEMQEGTGDGWPHWHMMLWCPDDRPVSELHRLACKHWVIREPRAFDLQTGEVTEWETLPLANPKAIHVEACRSAVGAGVYAAKYITKPWNAIPTWMLESSHQYRKLRCSDRVYEMLERLYRHDRKRGPAAASSGRRRAPARPLVERIATSGASLSVFRVEDAGRLKFAATLPVDVEDMYTAITQNGGGRFRPGKWKSVRAVVSRSVYVRLVADRERWRRAAGDRICDRRRRLLAAWPERHMPPAAVEDGPPAY